MWEVLKLILLQVLSLHVLVVMNTKLCSFLTMCNLQVQFIGSKNIDKCLSKSIKRSVTSLKKIMQIVK